MLLLAMWHQILKSGYNLTARESLRQSTVRVKPSQTQCDLVQSFIWLESFTKNKEWNGDRPLLSSPQNKRNPHEPASPATPVLLLPCCHCSHCSPVCSPPSARSSPSLSSASLPPPPPPAPNRRPGTGCF